MYTLLKNKEIKRITKAEIPCFFTALIFTETMYHFGSYALESAAFLATWFSLSFCYIKYFLSHLVPVKREILLRDSQRQLAELLYLIHIVSRCFKIQCSIKISITVPVIHLHPSDPGLVYPDSIELLSGTTACCNHH
jgi:hypothetical protein